MNFGLYSSLSFLGTNVLLSGGIVWPTNWLEMIIWYTLFVVCLIVFIVVLKKKRHRKPSLEIKDRISTLENFKKLMQSEKPMGKRVFYSNMFQLTNIRDFCKQSYDVSQFEVYNESAKAMKKLLDDVKDVELKTWNSEEMKKLKENIINNCDVAISFLQQAL